jgi:hypothetical protein
MALTPDDQKAISELVAKEIKAAMNGGNGKGGWRFRARVGGEDKKPENLGLVRANLLKTGFRWWMYGMMVLLGVALYIVVTGTDAVLVKAKLDLLLGAAVIWNPVTSIATAVAFAAKKPWEGEDPGGPRPEDRA